MLCRFELTCIINLSLFISYLSKKKKKKTCMRFLYPRNPAGVVLSNVWVSCLHYFQQAAMEGIGIVQCAFMILVIV